MDSRTFVVGDLHGCFLSFYNLMFNFIKISKNDKIILLGDYVDKGPRSKETLDLIMEMLISGYQLRCLMGNHELMLLNSIYSEEKLQIWKKNGGNATLKSFGISHPSMIKKKYMTFISNLFYYIELDNFICVHGGLNFIIDDPFEDLESMLWLRNATVDSSKIKGKKLIVGHTPSSTAAIIESLDSNKILLDGGCVYKNKLGELGKLYALEINEMKLYEQKCIDI